MRIVEGTIDDVIGRLDLIRSSIPQKADLTEREVRGRLDGRTYGVVLATDGESLQGILVWYEQDRGLYVWLGAVTLRRQGIATSLFEAVRDSTTYARWTVKTSRCNDAATAHLEKMGFRPYDVRHDTVTYERLW
ncbi:MAG: hypothetical protein ABIH41_03650 [Nanoarchaeota archaeon]